MVFGLSRLFVAKPEPKAEPQQGLPRVLWRLESCSCVLRYDEVTADDQFLRPMVVRDCGSHGSDLEPAEHFRRALAFNRTWATSRSEGG